MQNGVFGHFWGLLSDFRHRHYQILGTKFSNSGVENLAEDPKSAKTPTLHTTNVIELTWYIFLD